MCYPLVTTNIAIENHHLYSIFPLKMVIFHNYVELPEGNTSNRLPPLSSYVLPTSEGMDAFQPGNADALTLMESSRAKDQKEKQRFPGVVVSIESDVPLLREDHG